VRCFGKWQLCRVHALVYEVRRRRRSSSSRRRKVYSKQEEEEFV
jgi:hypothetical protein